VICPCAGAVAIPKVTLLRVPVGVLVCPQPPPLLETVTVQSDATRAWLRLPLVSQTFALGVPDSAAALTPFCTTSSGLGACANA